MSDENRTKNLVDPDSLSIVSSGKPVEQKKESFETIAHDAGVGLSTTELYDKLMKLIYVVDNSGSMAEGMALEDTIARYEWSPEVLKNARVEMKKYLKEAEAEQKAFDEDDEEMDDDTEFPEELLFDEVPDDDEELKRLIVEAGLIDDLKLKVPLKSSYGHFGASKSKIETVKEAARKFVEQRFQKYPDANVMLFGFDSEAYVLGRGISREEVLASIDNLNASGGDTRIVSAVRTSISECKKRPSQVGAHHVVLVTDGYDNQDLLMTSLLPELLEMGIVLDFIFVKGQSETSDNMLYKNKIDAIKETCAKTGGEYIEVGTAQDFEQKFLAVSNRPMLPWKS